jgi:tripartite motif-containing protein 71
VVDLSNHRIQIFDVDGNFLNKIDSAIGSSNVSFNQPEDMAHDPNTGDIYLTDTGNNRIVKFDENYQFILEWGEVGEGPGEFDHPHGIGVDP